MNLIRTGLVAPAVILGALRASGSQALLIDSFDTDVAPDSDSTFTPDNGADMVGDRTFSIDKTAGGGGANGPFANGTAAATATAVSIVFSSGDNAWDAQVDFIETIGPPGGNVSAPAPLALLGIGLAGLGLTHRRRS